MHDTPDLDMNTLSTTAPEPMISDLYPLDEFFARRNRKALILRTDHGQVEAAVLSPVHADPGVKTVLLWAPIEAKSIPQPFRTLLVHKTDMTSTLESFHGDKLRVELLSTHTAGQEYFREVVLCLEQDGKRTEFGAIKIMLDLFPREVREEILRERKPLGRILTDAGVEFSSQPRGYFELAPIEFISQSLGLTDRRLLYGRRNTLIDPWERPLAEIVEILPPV
jgi:chorismate-pyruvate lyase